MKVFIPQQRELEGEPPFGLRFHTPSGKCKLHSNRVLTWMISTKIPLKGVSFGGTDTYGAPPYPFYWDGPEEPEWTPRYEVIFGGCNDRKHGGVHRRWGTQPLNTYLRGHFCLKPIGNDLLTGWARANEVGEHVLVQQYFKSGWWGRFGDTSRITIREQLQQNIVTFPLLRRSGIIRDNTKLAFWDQSKQVSELPFGDDPFRLFLGKDLLEAYHRWLPEYLRHYRANDFNIPIEEVIETHVKRTCESLPRSG